MSGYQDHDHDEDVGRRDFGQSPGSGLGFLALGVVLLLCVVGLVLGVTYLVGSVSCQARYEGTAHASRYSFWGGCQVFADGWLPESKFNPSRVSVDKLEIEAESTIRRAER